MAADTNVDAVVFDLDSTLCVSEQSDEEIRSSVFDRAGLAQCGRRRTGPTRSTPPTRIRRRLTDWSRWPTCPASSEIRGP